jgi:DNA mismatch repair protein MutS
MALYSRDMQEKDEKRTMIQLYQNFYKEAKEAYGEKIIVLMQVGKFFEMYDILDSDTNTSPTNLREAASMLEITVSETPLQDKKVKLFAGFPEQSVKKYERIIIKQGFRGVFITQEKQGTKVTKREVSNIVSAGTFTDVEEDVKDRWLWSFFCEVSETDYLFHSAAINCSTGQIILGNTTVSARNEHFQADEIYLALSTYEPSEVIIWFDSQGFDADISEQFIRESFHLSPAISLHIRKHIALKGAAKREEDILIRAFAKERALLFNQLDLARKPELRSVLAHLLAFVEEHNPALIMSLQMPTDFQASNHVRLGNHMLEQIGMISSVPQECYFHFFNNGIKTACGRRALRLRLLQPIKDVAILRQRVKVIEGWQKGPLEAKQKVIHGLKKVYDIERLYRKLNLKSISVGDVWKLLSSIFSIHEIVEGAAACSYSANSALNIKEIESRWSLERLEACGSLGNGFGSTHPWKLGYLLEQDTYEQQWNSVKKEADSLLDSFKTIVPDGLQIVALPDAPFSFTATKTRCDKAAKAFTFRVEDNHGTFYVRGPIIDELNKKALVIQRSWMLDYTQAWNQEIAHLIQILEMQFPILLEIISTIDVDLTLAIKGEEYGYCLPVYLEGNTSGFSARGLRHGILERIRKEVSYIPHDIALGLTDESVIASSENGVLLFGVNSSGKSSLMKAIGLATLMAQAGCPVPATSFSIVPFSSIFTRILGNDNLWAGMSSFVVEMTEFRSILQYADSHSLVLGDELCAGTETASAAALVAAGLECLIEKDACFFFATHLHELHRFPELETRRGLKWLHLHVEYNQETGSLIYNRQMQEGSGSMMYGLEVCRALRMPSNFLEKATEFRRRISGLKAEGALGSPISRYNSSVIRNACEICKTQGSFELEVHHLVPQKVAKKNRGKIAPGVSMNQKSNLVVLCEKCHTNHHKGVLNIEGWKDTSSGRILSYTIV